MVSRLDKYIVFVLVFSLASLGCVAPQSGEETVLYDFQGLGVLSFGLPVVTGLSPEGTIQIIPPNGDAYVSLLIRNNAEGDYATNIVARLENVEPFTIKECHNEHYPYEDRGDNICAPYNEDHDLMYSEHKLGEMYPDQEVEFFWTLIAPDDDEVANMFYDHIVFYSVEYDYKVTSSQTIYAMTQAERTSRIAEEKAITGSMSTTHGEVSFLPDFNEPLIYSTGQSQGIDQLLKYKISNSNAAGTVKPGTKINITVTLPAGNYVSNSDNDTLNSYYWSNMLDDFEMQTWFIEKFLSDVSDDDILDIIRRTIFTQIDSEFIRETGSQYSFYVPFRLSEDITPTVLTLPFYLRISYRYLLDCKNAADCAQLRVEPLR